jgi:hypothetical protein
MLFCLSDIPGSRGGEYEDELIALMMEAVRSPYHLSTLRDLHGTIFVNMSSSHRHREKQKSHLVNLSGKATLRCFRRLSSPIP